MEENKDQSPLPGIDPLLEELVAGHPGFGVTLFTRGSAISGFVADRDVFFKEVRGEDEEPNDFSKMIDALESFGLPEDAQDEPVAIEEGFVHLVDAVVFIGPQQFGVERIRVSLASVDAFCFGRMSKDKRDDEPDSQAA